MKRLIAFIMSVLLILSMSACDKSKEEKELDKELEQAKKSAEAFNRATDEQRQKTEDIMKLMDEYEDAVSKLKNAD